MKYFGTEVGVEFVLTEEKEVVFEKHNHVSKFVVGLILLGKVQVEVQVANTNEIRVCTKDDLYLIPMGTVHRVSICDSETKVLSMCVGERFLLEHELKDAISVIHEYTKKMISLKILNANQASAFDEALEAFYYMLHEDENEKVTPASILKEQIISQPESELSLEEMSKQVFISKYYLLRQFKEQVGLTPHYFQIQNRIRKAKQLMNEGKALTDVAVETGFYDQSHFIRSFHKFTGMTPQEYLQSICSLEKE